MAIATTIHHNCTEEAFGDYYGLRAYDQAYDSSSSIHLASPLTIENISTNNDGNGNYGGRGTIEQIE